jgi:ATP-binding cassette subfamily F protein uup
VKTASGAPATIPTKSVETSQRVVVTPARARGTKLAPWETKELDELPAVIQGLEAEQESLVAQMSDSALYKNEPAKFSAIQEKLAHIEKELAKKFERWEALEAKSLA